MPLKIKADHARFKEIVRGRIKENLRKYVQKGELIGKKGKDLVSIPVPSIDIPHFIHGPATARSRDRAMPARTKASTRSRSTSRSTSSRRSSAKVSRSPASSRRATNNSRRSA